MPSIRRSGRVRVTVQIPAEQYRRLTTLLRVLGETDAPYLRQALSEAAQLMAEEVERRAPSVVRPTIRAVEARTATAGARVDVGHPATKVLEFGKRKVRTLRPRARKALYGPGMRHPVRRVRWGPIRPRPFIGIVDRGHAIGAAQPRIQEMLARAIEVEFERMAGGA
jgi:hypothetical protein